MTSASSEAVRVCRLHGSGLCSSLEHLRGEPLQRYTSRLSTTTAARMPWHKYASEKRVDVQADAKT